MRTGQAGIRFANDGFALTGTADTPLPNHSLPRITVVMACALRETLSRIRVAPANYAPASQRLAHSLALSLSCLPDRHPSRGSIATAGVRSVDRRSVTSPSISDRRLGALSPDSFPNSRVACDYSLGFPDALRDHKRREVVV